MNKHGGARRWVPILGWAMLLAAPAAPAATTMEGEVTLDYYVADTDPEGFEFVDAGFFVERIANSSASASGPLSVAGWLTEGASPAGPGTDVAEASVGTIPGSSSLLNFSDTVPADDAAPGEYHAHVLLQNDSFPGTYEDARTMSPNLLWRGGLEAVGPLEIFPYDSGYSASVDFSQLRNNRIDAAVSRDIALTLFATHGFGPASSGYTLCSAIVPGLYAGDGRFQPGFSCELASVPDGEYTLHLEVAEVGGRGGYSTLSGPDVRFVGGGIDDGSRNDGYLYVTGALDAWALLPLLLFGLPRRKFLRSKS